MNKQELNKQESKSKETKREKFIRVAESRTNKILSMIRLLGNCSSKAVYDYTDQDIKKIFSAIETEIRNTREKFAGHPEQTKRFKL